MDKKSFLQQVTTLPGVYQMLDKDGKILYVGKAKNLKNRLSSYFQTTLSSKKTQSLMTQVHDIEVIVTNTENEALLLECNLIKKHRPRYNILMRDDKSYPYIFISSDPYPRIVFHRSRMAMKPEKGKYFGPYPNSTAARETLNLLQKLFPVRQCTNTFFQNRSRPCLQYQIKRCTAPCVKLISVDDYAKDVKLAEMFLSGKDNQVVANFTELMDKAASLQRYEDAAFYRNKIFQLRTVQEHQSVSKMTGDADVIVVAHLHQLTCVQVVHFREGRLLANQSFYPKIPHDSSDEEIISAFVGQYYLTTHTNRHIPKSIITNVEVMDKAWLNDALAKIAHHKVSVMTRVKGEKQSWVNLALLNAKQSLTQKISHHEQLEQRYHALQQALDIAVAPERMECFDISHTAGNQTVASCVVFDRNGPRTADYRRFNITNVTPGDDYAAMHQVLKRRYSKFIAEETKLPDVILIDGGKGQLAKAVEVLTELGVPQALVVAISKGRSRKPGLETLHLPGKPPLQLSPDSEALHLLQHIRDEAHRFAITGHKARREKQATQSPLESIEGIGPSRRRDLLRHFGGLQGIHRAGLEDLMKVKGINKELAQRIYDTLHEAT